MVSFNPDKPYNRLPSLPPKQSVETTPVLKACIAANAALARLDQAAAGMPNPAVLINTIPLLEAQDSSRIENIVTTTDDLFQHAVAEHDDASPETREALRYRTALHDGFRSLESRPVCTATAVTVCQTIKNTDLDVRQVPGTQLVNPDAQKVVYTPPEGEERLREKLANWERYLHEHDDIDVLIRMAVGHYQFEAIHPFVDGNGRTGRVLNSLYLVDKGLLSLPILYLSRYIIENRSDYYRLLLDVTSQHAWEPWILYMLEGVRITSTWTLERIRAIGDLQAQTAEHLRAHEPKIYSHELVELIFTQPYCRVANLVDADIAKRQTASRYLSVMKDLEILKQVKLGRENIFINTRLMQLLTQGASDVPGFD